MLGFDWLLFQAKLELVSVCVMCFFTYLDPGITCSCLSFPFMSTATCVRPDVLERNHQLVSDLSQLCGTLNPDGWTVRYCQSPCPERSASRGVFNTSASSPLLSLVQVSSGGAPCLHPQRNMCQYPEQKKRCGRAFHLQGGGDHGETEPISYCTKLYHKVLQLV